MPVQRASEPVAKRLMAIASETDCKPLAHRDRSLSAPQRLYAAALVLALLAPAAFAIDLPVSNFCISGQGIVPDAVRKIVNLRKLISLAEVFSHGLGVGLVIVAVITLDRSRRWIDAPRLIACSLGAGLTADAAKLLVGRTRPQAFDFEGRFYDTFTGWAPILSMESFREALDKNIQSFPSGHTATAFGLAVVLSWRYPHGRVLFFCLAIFAALQRIDIGAHYVSDTLAAAAIGCVVAALCIDPRRRLCQMFDRLETRDLPATHS